MWKTNPPMADTLARLCAYGTRALKKSNSPKTGGRISKDVSRLTSSLTIHQAEPREKDATRQQAGKSLSREPCMTEGRLHDDGSENREILEKPLPCKTHPAIIILLLKIRWPVTMNVILNILGGFFILLMMYYGMVSAGETSHPMYNISGGLAFFMLMLGCFFIWLASKFR